MVSFKINRKASSSTASETMVVVGGVVGITFGTLVTGGVPGGAFGAGTGVLSLGISDRVDSDAHCVAGDGSK